jgi:hypothetical protein
MVLKRVYFIKIIISDELKLKKKIQEIPITLDRAKPYLTANVIVGNQSSPVKLLVDEP